MKFIICEFESIKENEYVKVEGPDMEMMRVKKNYQITIPRSLREKVRLEEGDYLEFAVQDGCILLRPAKVIHPDQEYFYTKEWQEKEAEVDEEIRKGEVVGPFDNVKDALNVLKTAKI